MVETHCSHVKAYIETEGMYKFHLLYSYFVKPSTREAKIKKAVFCLCSVCNDHSPRLHACLSCFFFGCYDTGHIQGHSKNENHYLAIDVNQGHIFCFPCGDYVYSMALRRITAPLKIKWLKSLGMRSFYRAWEPSPNEVDLLIKHNKRRRIIPDSIIGLRGLVNLGQTCYMNCVVQVLMHTPLLRNYFLSDLHDCQRNNQPDDCLVCVVTNTYQEFYSGDKNPLILNTWLCLIWNHAPHLSGCQQHDAQEFFIACLDVLHRHFEDSKKKISSGRCSCIIDQVFTGGLQSDVVCIACNNVSTTIDPFWDISLDLGSSVANRTLIDCLERFTRCEQLDENAKIKCTVCDQDQVSTKQLTMRNLPLVACFQLKRFEHISKHTRIKISTYVSFPEQLDMTPFMTQHRNLKGKNVNEINAYKYSLFAVIEHLGDISGGHYVSYIRQQKDHWFKCNDTIITKVNINDVLNCEGYLLFYHKQVLEYD